MAVFGLLQNSRRLKCKRITTMRLCSPSSSLLVVVGNGLRHWSNAWCYGGRHLEVIGFAVARLVGNRGCVLGLVLVLVFFFFIVFFYCVRVSQNYYFLYVCVNGWWGGGGGKNGEAMQARSRCRQNQRVFHLPLLLQYHRRRHQVLQCLAIHRTLSNF